MVNIFEDNIKSSYAIQFIGVYRLDSLIQFCSATYFKILANHYVTSSIELDVSAKRFYQFRIYHSLAHKFSLYMGLFGVKGYSPWETLSGYAVLKTRTNVYLEMNPVNSVWRT